VSCPPGSPSPCQASTWQASLSTITASSTTHCEADSGAAPAPGVGAPVARLGDRDPARSHAAAGPPDPQAHPHVEVVADLTPPAAVGPNPQGSISALAGVGDLELNLPDHLPSERLHAPGCTGPEDVKALPFQLLDRAVKELLQHHDSTRSRLPVASTHFTTTRCRRPHVLRSVSSAG
jgi:hypothetical protein